MCSYFSRLNIETAVIATPARKSIGVKKMFRWELPKYRDGPARFKTTADKIKAMPIITPALLHMFFILKLEPRYLKIRIQKENF